MKFSLNDFLLNRHLSSIYFIIWFNRIKNYGYFGDVDEIIVSTKKNENNLPRLEPTHHNRCYINAETIVNRDAVAQHHYNLQNLQQSCNNQLLVHTPSIHSHIFSDSVKDKDHIPPKRMYQSTT